MLHPITMLLAFNYPRNDGIATLVFAAIAILVPLLFIVFAIRWACEDAEERGMPKVVAVILVVLFFPVGWIFWLIFRPRKRGFDFELYKHTFSGRPQRVEEGEDDAAK